MTKTAILFIDTKKRFDDRQMTASVEITDVPLVKRILIDLRRAGMENIFAVMDERTPEIEAILDDTKRTNFKRLVFGEHQWRDEILAAGDDKALVLTADRLSDYRFLQTLADARGTSSDDEDAALISYDRKKTNEGSLTEKRFVSNDGKIIDRKEIEAAKEAGEEAIGEVGIYSFPVKDIAKFEAFDPAYLKARADEYLRNGKAEYFDIGNGFVETIDSRESVRRAEQRLIRYIWKLTDGKHGRLNKRIILPLLKLLLRTPVTPNMVSLVGVIVSLFSGYFYFKGYYTATLIGGLLALASSLLDHVDGCIARIKSKESEFGAHFDTICDYVFYFSFGFGMTAGLYRETLNPIYIGLGVAVVFGTLITFFTTSYQRRTFASNASLYAAEAHKKLKANSQNPIFRYAHRVYFVARRPAMPYYIFFFTAINLLPFILFMVALGSNLFWMFHLYTNRRLYRPQPKNSN
jgi:phosphatidylglycerophosphate synthase